MMFYLQYRAAFPVELKETCMFADLFPLFQEMADQVLKQQLKLREAKLNEVLLLFAILLSVSSVILLLGQPVNDIKIMFSKSFSLMFELQALDEGNGFRCTHEIHSYELASLAIDQVILWPYGYFMLLYDFRLLYFCIIFLIILYENSVFWKNQMTASIYSSYESETRV